MDQAKDGMESFLECYPHPFLVVVESPEKNDGPGDEFYTTEYKNVNLKLLMDIATGRRLDPQATVHPVIRRSGRNSKNGIVTIGRTEKCDIVLPFSGISKLHCYIAQSPLNPAQYQIADSGSSNGTQINKKMLTPNKLVVLLPGATITIGRQIVMRFFPAREMWDLLSQ